MLNKSGAPLEMKTAHILESKGYEVQPGYYNLNEEEDVTREIDVIGILDSSPSFDIDGTHIILETEFDIECKNMEDFHFFSFPSLFYDGSPDRTSHLVNGYHLHFWGGALSDFFCSKRVSLVTKDNKKYEGDQKIYEALIQLKTGVLGRFQLWKEIINEDYNHQTRKSELMKIWRGYPDKEKYYYHNKMVPVIGSDKFLKDHKHMWKEEKFDCLILHILEPVIVINTEVNKVKIEDLKVEDYERIGFLNYCANFKQNSILCKYGAGLQKPVGISEIESLPKYIEKTENIHKKMFAELEKELKNNPERIIAEFIFGQGETLIH
jgi:hypothetical protein